MAAVVTSSQPTAERTRFLGTFWRSLPRNQFFAGLYILGSANGLGGNVVPSLTAGDWTGGIENISVLGWFALFAGIYLLFRENKAEVKPRELALGGDFVGIISAA